MGLKKNTLVGIVAIFIIVGAYFVYQSVQTSQPINEQETKVEMGFQTSCQIDTDCKKYISHNNCELYCANDEEINNEVLSGFKVTCDSTLWDPPFGRDCKCINNICQFID